MWLKAEENDDDEEDEEQFYLQRCWNANKKSAVMAIDLNHAENMVAIGLKNNCLGTFEMG